MVVFSHGRATPDASEHMGKTKGSSIRAGLEWYATTRGREAMRALATELPAEMHVELDPGALHLGVLASAWYDDDFLHWLCDRISDGLNPTARASLAARVSHATTRATLGGLYSVFFRAFVGPATYARRAQRLWDLYWDNGAYTVRETGQKRHEITVSHWQSHHPFVCEGLVGSSMAIYEAMGCKDVAVTRLACVSDGALACKLSVAWS
jgi:hypothetical protein